MMHDEPNERYLSVRFAEARAHDAQTTPSLTRVLANRPNRRPRRWLQPAVALGAMAMLIVAVIVWRGRPDVTQNETFAGVPSTLRVPTDYLLDLAMTSRAGEIPSIGITNWYPLAAAPTGLTRDTRRRN